MEILVLQDGKFQWKEVVVNDATSKQLFTNSIYKTVDDSVYRDNNIYAIRNDIRKTHVMCASCGKIMTKAAFKNHGKGFDASNPPCMKCQYKKFSEKETIKEDIKLVGSEYVKTKKTICKLLCGKSYTQTPEQAIARDYCVLKQCSKKNPARINSDFIEHPNLFETVATIQALSMHKKWNYETKDDNQIIYRLGSTNLTAHVNRYGIIYQFEYYNRHDGRHIIKYSATTNEFYVSQRYSDRFTKSTLQFVFPESKVERWKQYIRELYMEE